MKVAVGGGGGGISEGVRGGRQNVFCSLKIHPTPHPHPILHNGSLSCRHAYSPRLKQSAEPYGAYPRPASLEVTLRAIGHHTLLSRLPSHHNWDISSLPWPYSVKNEVLMNVGRNYNLWGKFCAHLHWMLALDPICHRCL